MIRPIDIKIKDDGKYRLIAFLVDRPDFLRDIESIRKKLLNSSHLLPYSAVIGYLKELGIKAKQEDKRLDDLWVRKSDGTDLIIFTNAEFVDDIHWLKKKYKKNMCYEMAIAFAILSGIVKDSEFTTTVYVQYLDKNSLKNFVLDGHFQTSIVVLPETRINEVEKVFNSEVRRFLKDIEFPKPDTFSNLRRDRKWYWLKQSLGWKKLCKFVNKNEKEHISDEGIRSAVRQYQKQLKTPLYSSTPPGALRNS